ncbi:TetR family transcriptional regulator [Antrihabitans sp. NCIMB 15449]|uniref:TetR family transcriptional regulator n=1 Tax=Antrihabitans spumae TaxID=3373370 RepID=A0ABW7JKZ7_9NOCA
MSVNEMVRAARTEAGLSVREVARRVGVSAATISAIENGRTGVSVDRLRALADALGTDATLLLNPPMRRARVSRPGPLETPPAQGDWRVFPELTIDPVLAAAVACFVETGYHGATMRGLAERAGMSVPGVYHHYRDKQDLLIRLFDITMDELHWRVTAARDEGETSVERIAAIVEALALYHTHRRDLAFIGASEMRSLVGADRIRITVSRNAIQYVLDEQIDAAVAEGQLRTAHARNAGRAVATMCTSLCQWFRMDGPSSPEEIAAEYANFALDLLQQAARESFRRAGPPKRRTRRAAP